MGWGQQQDTRTHRAASQGLGYRHSCSSQSPAGWGQLRLPPASTGSSGSRAGTAWQVGSKGIRPWGWGDPSKQREAGRGCGGKDGDGPGQLGGAGAAEEGQLWDRLCTYVGTERRQSGTNSRNHLHVAERGATTLPQLPRRCQ